MLTLLFLIDTVLGSIRGVSLTRQSFYVPSKNNEFGCLDGSGMIPYDQLNDDFCDCADGSDEPGTSACPNGLFHCPNAGFKPENIFSSRVNDMICDCCDGSDEWAGYVSCPNTCKQAYKEYFAEKLKAQEDQLEGFKIKESLETEAKGVKEKLVEEKNKLQADLNDLKAEKDELEELRIQADEKEAEEKAKIEKNRIEKVIEKSTKYTENQLIQIGFEFLDTNRNEEIAAYELTAKKYLNPNKDSASFLHKDAKEMMQEKDPMSFEDFKSILWPAIKDKLIPNLASEFENFDRKQAEAENNEAEDNGTEDNEDVVEEVIDFPEDEKLSGSEMDELREDIKDFEPEINDESEDWEDDDWHEDYEDYDDDYYNHDDNHNETPTDNQLDPESQAIFDAAKTARDNYNNVNDKYREIENRIEDIDDQIKYEFGPNDIFITMYKTCFEFKTSEYIYSVCPYEKATQRPANGGSETNLGKWESWSEDFTEMKFTKGTRCWNGPDRSTIVKVKCGKENRLFSVDEPNRCEYEYKFETPTVCNKPEPIPLHDEL